MEGLFVARAILDWPFLESSLYLRIVNAFVNNGGQKFCWRLQDFAESTGLSVKTIRGLLGKLERRKAIIKKGTHNGISIALSAKYQDMVQILQNAIPTGGADVLTLIDDEIEQGTIGAGQGQDNVDDKSNNSNNYNENLLEVGRIRAGSGQDKEESFLPLEKPPLSPPLSSPLQSSISPPPIVPPKVTPSFKEETVALRLTRDSEGKASSESRIPKRTHARGAINPDIKAFIDYAYNTHQEQYSLPLVVNGGKDGSLVKRLLGSGLTLERLKACWDAFLVDDYQFIANGGRDIGRFASLISRYSSGNGRDLVKPETEYVTMACAICKGKDPDCKACHGTNEITVAKEGPRPYRCNLCLGSGTVPTSDAGDIPCIKCHGTGSIWR